MIVWISGPTGSGKSTLARLVGRLGYKLIREDLPPDLFRAFREDPARHCASLQEAIMLSRLAQWKRAANEKKIAFDRSVDEDIDVFCRMHHERGLLDYAAHARLRVLAEEVIAEIPKPDLIAFLSPPVAVLKARMQRDGHPDTIIESLERQVAIYEEWIGKRREAVIRIDNSACSRAALEGFFGAATGPGVV
jgi:deoxyadenosine/deoxycytidine kinase